MDQDNSLQQTSLLKNMWAEVDDAGYHHQLVDCIIDHRSDHTAMKKGDEYYVSKSRWSTQRKTTHGWFIKIQWKDGSTSWKSLIEIKEYIPVNLPNMSLVLE